jgi:hypothetical protein
MTETNTLEPGAELNGEDYRRYLVCLWSEADGDDWTGRWFHDRDSAVTHLLEQRALVADGRPIYDAGALYDLDRSHAMLAFPEDWDGHSGPSRRSKGPRA